VNRNKNWKKKMENLENAQKKSKKEGPEQLTNDQRDLINRRDEYYFRSQEAEYLLQSIKDKLPEGFELKAEKVEEPKSKECEKKPSVEKKEDKNRINEKKSTERKDPERKEPKAKTPQVSSQLETQPSLVRVEKVVEVREKEVVVTKWDSTLTILLCKLRHLNWTAVRK